jgi:L-alanine-DL-glutamate epimerase-like enolase superfamily enzyme
LVGEDLRGLEHDRPDPQVTEPVQEIDLFWQMLEEPLRPVGGHASASTRPGLGVTLDRAAVGRRAVSVETTTG